MYKVKLFTEPITILTMKLLLGYLSLCFFRNNPMNLTPHDSFMWKTIGFYLVSGMIVEGLISDPADGTLEVLMRTVMAFSFISVFLLLKRQWPNFRQLFVAIFVCENFIMTLAVATEVLYIIMIRNHMEYYEEISIGLGIFLVGWYVAVISYIFRQSFSYATAFSVILATSYFVMAYGLPMLMMDI